MIDWFFHFFLIIFILFTTSYANRRKILQNFTGYKHQNFLKEQKTVPLLGGFFLIIFLIYFHKFFILEGIIFLFLFFLIGLASDTKYEISPKLRFIIQFVLSLFFVTFLDLTVTDLRISYLNYLLSFNFFSIFFISFCVVTILNGSNFIDGNNTLLIGYYLIISSCINLFLPSLINIQFNFLFINLNLLLVILFIFNFFEKFYMGDSGAYLLSIFFSIILITIYKNNLNISPYFIATLLWYPAFENLFSILRKSYEKKTPLEPDNKHLHQLLFKYLKQSSKYNSSLLNSMTSNIINFYNLIVFIIASQFIFETNVQVLLLIINTSLYLIVYNLLIKKNM